jgi:putative FmdB family regulatory protein
MYEFDCHECGEPFEELVLSASRVSEVTCPSCGSRQVKKKLSTFASRVGRGASASSSQASCSPGGL